MELLHTPAPSEISLLFTDDREIQVYNQRYLHRSYPTDVLSFPLWEKAGEWMCIGDIAISLESARREAKLLHSPFRIHLLTLAIHGLLHLLGYEDSTPSLRQKMLRRQTRVVNQILRELVAGRNEKAKSQMEEDV